MTTNPSFFNKPPNDWDILDYLNQHDPTSPEYDHTLILDRWTKALTAIANDVGYTSEQRGRARHLLERYRHQGRSSDRNRAREWLSKRQPTKKRKLKSGASVTIFQAPVNQGTFNNATFHQEVVCSPSASGSAPELPEVCETQTVYQAPVNRGTFNESTFNQTVNKRKLPEDPEASDSEDDATGVDEPYPDHASEPNSASSAEHVAPSPKPKKRNDPFPAIYKDFLATYNAMPTSSKYTFSFSGRILEDVIYEKARALTTMSTAHLWVLDPDDRIIASWFDSKELDELRSHILPLPEPDKVFLASMARFSRAETAEDYRRIAESVPYRQPGESYDRTKHFDAAWVNTVILSMLSILESPTNLLLHPALQEGWYDCNPWSFLIDQCLLSLPGVLVQRKEILCLALKLASPPPSTRTRFDGILHTLGDSPAVEYAAIEVSKSFESTNTPKWLCDSTKLLVALRAMLGRLSGLVGNDPETVRRLQVCGLMNAGRNMQVVRMCGVGNNVGVLQRGRMRALPSCVQGLKGVFEVMVAVWVFKRMVGECVDVVRGYGGEGEAWVEGLGRGGL